MASRAVGLSRVIVLSGVRDLAKHAQKELASSSVQVETFPVTDVQSEDRAKQLREAEVLLCDAPVLLKLLEADALPSLKWAQLTWAGVDMLMKELNYQKPKKDFTVVRSGGAYGDVMGEYVIGQIIARERNFAGMKLAQDKKEFDVKFKSYRPAQSLSIGILGYGTIGKRVAEVCKFFGMTVWAVNRTRNTSPSSYVDHFRGLDGLGEVLQSVDYLCSIVPDTPASCDLLSGDVLKQCQNKKTVLINIGRGNVISDESLARAIREGWLGGAILDVFNQEPLPPDSELWTLPNVVITPHMSGVAVGELIYNSSAEGRGYGHDVVRSFIGGEYRHDVVRSFIGGDYRHDVVRSFIGGDYRHDVVRSFIGGHYRHDVVRSFISGDYRHDVVRSFIGGDYRQDVVRSFISGDYRHDVVRSFSVTHICMNTVTEHLT
ncbi:hypothetical protein ACOMHN_044818 [Nucella lapillus]